jgi:hypothetical protein
MSEIKVEKIWVEPFFSSKPAGNFTVQFTEPVRLFYLGPAPYWNVCDKNNPHGYDYSITDKMAAFKWAQWVIASQSKWEKEYG